MKKIVCLLLALTFVFALTACGGSGSGSGTTGGDKVDISNITFPYEGDPITISVMDIDYRNDERKYDGIINEKLQEMLGNITIQYDLLPSGDFSSQYNIRAATGDLSDINIGGNGQDVTNNFAETGNILDLTPYLDGMKNYKALAEKYSNVYSYFGGDGKVYALTQVLQENRFAFNMTWNEYYTNKYGIEKPTTMDELLAALRQVKKINPNSYPFMSWPNGWLQQLNVIYLGLSPWCVDLNAGIQMVFDWEDTQKFIMPIYQEGMKAEIEFLHTCYEEELIPPDFLTMTQETCNKIILGSGVDWLIYTSWPVPADFDALNASLTAKYPEYGYSYMQNPKSPITDISYIWPNVEEGAGPGCITVSAYTEHPDIVCALLDYLLSDEVDTLVNWGIEGETFEVVDGEKKFLDTVYCAANPTGTLNLAKDFGLYPHVNYHQFSWASSMKTVWTAQTSLDLGARWQESQYALQEYGTTHPEAVVKRVIKDVAYTPDEKEEFSVLLGKANTFISEQLTSFVIGTRDLSEWDDMLSELEALIDMDRLLELSNSKEFEPIVKETE